jgi:hypothetical protein
MLLIFKTISPKTNGVFTQNNASLCKMLIVPLVFKKTVIFRRNWRKSPKLAKIAEIGENRRNWRKSPKLAKIAEIGENRRNWRKSPKIVIKTLTPYQR